MKDSMRTRLDNLWDQRGHAIWQKGTVLIFLFFLATWKDILHLAHISWILCILESKGIANITKQNKNTAMKLYKVTYTDSMCVWNILYMCYITDFFFVFVQQCSTAPRVKLVIKWTVKHEGRKQEIPWENSVLKKQQQTSARTKYRWNSLI